MSSEISLSILFPDQGLSLKPELSVAPQSHSEIFHRYHLRFQLGLAPPDFPIGARDVHSTPRACMANTSSTEHFFLLGGTPLPVSIRSSLGSDFVFSSPWSYLCSESTLLVERVTMLLRLCRSKVIRL